MADGVGFMTGYEASRRVLEEPILHRLLVALCITEL